MTKELCCARKINKDAALLVVVDMQDKILKVMSRRLELVNAVEKLVKGFRILDVPLLFTQQYTKGLGPTAEEIVEAATMIVDTSEDNITTASENPINTTQILEPAKFTFVEKHAFSVVGEPDFNRELKRYEATDIIVCGIETHVCLQQSVLDFLEQGYNVFVAADGCSSRTEVDYERSLSRMEAAGAVITTVESILFELLEDAKNPKFKEISKLVK